MEDNNKIKNLLLRFLIFAAFGLAVIFGAVNSLSIYQELDISIEISRFFEPGTFFLLAAVAPVAILNLLLRYLRWAFLLRSFNLLAKSRELFVSYLTAFIGNFFPFYLPYLIRLIPLKHKLLSAFLILALDLAFDFLAILLLAHFKGLDILYIAMAVFLASVAMTALIPSRGASKKNSFPAQILSLALAGSFSVIIWMFTSISLFLSASAFGLNLPFSESWGIFSQSLLEGASSYIPAGISVTGLSMIESLKTIGASAETAAYITISVRSLTFWLTALISIVAFVYYVRKFGSKKNTYHFDEIAGEYEGNIPEHLRKRFLEKKIAVNLKYLPHGDYKKGADVGCGHGWYLKEMLDKGYDISGVDYSKGQVDKAREFLGEKHSERVKVASIANLPYKDSSLDFVYTINIIHHLESHEAQQEAYSEVYRALRPGGRFIIHEMNIKNPLFRFYLGYIFPLIKSIDEGAEIWIKGKTDFKQLFKESALEYRTFTPDFFPRFINNYFNSIEKFLEKNRFTKTFSAHISFILDKI